MKIPISTVEQLQAMRDDLRGRYVLINDIDASDTANWNGGLGFEPVGTFDEVGSRETGFEGFLDGRGHTIHGLYINRPTESHVGLFGVVRQNPDNVDEVSIRDVRISGASIRGDTHVGTFAGRFGVANFRGGRVRMLRCAADGVVTGNDAIGGMCGWAEQRTLAEGVGIEDCISRVDVIHEGASGNAGGFLRGYYNKSYRCLSTGEVLWAGNGGFQAPSGSPPSTIVEACFWDIESSGQSASHSIPGAAATGLTSSEAKSISTYTDAGWDIVPRKSKDHIWGIHPTINDGYPFLQVFERKQRGLILNHLQSTSTDEDATSYTFGGVHFGNEATARRIVICVMSRHGIARPRPTIASVTIGGVPADIAVQHTNQEGVHSCVAGIAIAHVPGGTSGDIEVVFDRDVIRLGIEVYRIDGLIENAAYDRAIAEGRYMDTEMLAAAGGVIIGCATCGWNTGSTAPVFDYLGLEKNNQVEVEASVFSSGSRELSESERHYSIEVALNNTSNIQQPISVFASWSPVRRRHNPFISPVFHSLRFGGVT